MARVVEFIPHSTNIRFMRMGNVTGIVSALLVIATIAFIALRGLNMGIDFAGGILLEIRTQDVADLSALRPLLTDPAFGDTSLQHFGDEKEVLIRLEGNPNVEQATIVTQVKDIISTHYGNDVEFRRVDYVGPTIGAEMLQSGAYALLFAFGGMLLYIWFRFEWQFGLGALLALIHDATLTIGFYALLDIEFGLSAIAAILTVIGYSINDSVVIFDRIRENMRRHSKKPLQDIIDLSLNQTLSRTVLTGITTLLAAGTLAVLGGDIIRGFALALCFGVIIGTYSSIYVAAPLLHRLNVSRDTFLTEEEEAKKKA